MIHLCLSDCFHMVRIEENGRCEKFAVYSDWRYPSVVVTTRACLVCLLVHSFGVSLRLYTWHCMGTHGLHRLGVLLLRLQSWVGILI